MRKKLYIPFVLVLLLSTGCSTQQDTITADSTQNQTSNVTESSKGGTGTGMFEFPNQSSITINYKDNEIEVTDASKIQELVELCEDSDWCEIDNDSYSKEDCDIWIDFNTDRAIIGIVSGTSFGFLNDSLVSIPTSLNEVVESLVTA